MLVASASHCGGISSVTSPLRHQAAEFTALHPAMSDNRQMDELAPEQGEPRDLFTPATMNACGSTFKGCNQFKVSHVPDIFSDAKSMLAQEPDAG